MGPGLPLRGLSAVITPGSQRATFCRDQGAGSESRPRSCTGPGLRAPRHRRAWPGGEGPDAVKVAGGIAALAVCSRLRLPFRVPSREARSPKRFTSFQLFGQRTSAGTRSAPIIILASALWHLQAEVSKPALCKPPSFPRRRRPSGTLEPGHDSRGAHISMRQEEVHNVAAIANVHVHRGLGLAVSFEDEHGTLPGDG